MSERLPSATVTAEVSHTHGVSSMTLQTLAMVLRQSVVFSSGRVLFCTEHLHVFNSTGRAAVDAEIVHGKRTHRRLKHVKE